MKYRLVQNVEGTFIQSEFDGIENFRAAMTVRDYTVIGFSFNRRHREELQGQPVFASLCGPMWDGDAVRYEDQRSNDILSA